MGSGGLPFNRLGYGDKINSSGPRNEGSKCQFRHVETQYTEHYEANVLKIKSRN